MKYANEEKVDIITVSAEVMTKKEYEAMETDINTSIIRDAGYTVYAYCDCSGYKYWKNQASEGEANYIQVTAVILDTAAVDVKKLKEDVTTLYLHFQKYNSLEKRRN